MKVVFSDLDGTLLDHFSYSPEEAKPAIALLRRKKIPLVLVTSKTRAELLHWQKKLGLKAPFIPENGAAIFIPKGYFSFRPKGARRRGDFFVIEFSPGIKKVKCALAKLSKKGFQTKGFTDMGVDEVIGCTGLTRKGAELAKKREYDEAFLLEKGGAGKIGAEIRKMGFSHTQGGRFHHIFKGHDKGKAVAKLTEFFGKEFGEVESIGLGDSPNDFEMLRAAGKGYLVKRHDGTYASQRFLKAGAIGPQGWAKVVERFAKD